MPGYIRPRVPGATIFFTVTAAERQCDLLVREIAVLREAVRATKAEQPFLIDAWVVLPDHLHCVWTLPEGDADYSTRWGAIKARFSMRRAGFTPPHPAKNTPRLQAQSANGGVNPALCKGEAGL